MALTAGLVITVILTGFLGELQCNHFSLLNNVQDVMISFLNESLSTNYKVHLVEEQLIFLYGTFVVSVWVLGALIGVIAAVRLSEKCGRKDAIFTWTGIITIAASACFFLAKGFCRVEFVSLGRFLDGISFGIYILVGPMYIMESAPNEYRGSLASSIFIFDALACVLGTILGLPWILGTKDLWPYLLGMGAIPGLIKIVIAPYFPETPKFLYISLGDEDAAERALKFFHGTNSDVEETFDEYDKEKSLCKTGLIQILTTRHLRMPLVLCIALSLLQATNGTKIMIFYSTEVFQQLGFTVTKSMLYTISCTSIGLFASVLAACFIDKYGRRPLILGSVGLSFVGCFLVFISESFRAVTHLKTVFCMSIVGDAFLIFAYYFGIGPIPDFIFCEITPETSHSIVGCISLAINLASTVFVTGLFPILHEAIGPWVLMALCIIPTASIFIFLEGTLPESKGRPVSEIVAQWVLSGGESWTSQFRNV